MTHFELWQDHLMITEIIACQRGQPLRLNCQRVQCGMLLWHLRLYGHMVINWLFPDSRKRLLCHLFFVVTPEPDIGMIGIGALAAVPNELSEKPSAIERGVAFIAYIPASMVCQDDFVTATDVLQAAPFSRYRVAHRAPILTLTLGFHEKLVVGGRPHFIPAVGFKEKDLLLSCFPETSRGVCPAVNDCFELAPDKVIDLQRAI